MTVWGRSSSTGLRLLTKFTGVQGYIGDQEMFVGQVATLKGGSSLQSLVWTDNPHKY